MKRLFSLFLVIGVLPAIAQTFNCEIKASANDICPGDDVTLTYTVDQPTNYALEFNGADQIVEISHNANLDFGTGDFTVELWFNTFVANNNGTLITKATAAGVGYTIGLVGTSVTCVVNDGTTPIILTDPTVISANTWYHVAVVFDRAANATIYVDGMSGTGGQLPITALGNISNVEPIAIGGPATTTPGVQPYFFGAIDEVRIWGRKVAQSELTSNSSKHINADVQQNLNGYWDLNEGVPPQVVDCSPTMEVGNLLNSPSFSTNTPLIDFNLSPIWSNGDFGNTIIVIPGDTTSYAATSGYCKYYCTDTFTINVIDCDTIEKDYKLTSVWVPSSFTPNGDNINDLFLIQGSFVYDYEIMVYNRYGNIMYHSKDMNNAWDGTFEGKRVKDGTYTYIVRYRNEDGEQFRKYGYVTLNY